MAPTGDRTQRIGTQAERDRALAIVQEWTQYNPALQHIFVQFVGEIDALKAQVDALVDLLPEAQLEQWKQRTIARVSSNLSARTQYVGAIARALVAGETLPLSPHVPVPPPLPVFHIPGTDPGSET